MFFLCSTVRCLGVLSGSMLLGMTREELKTVCPEEGGRVFFQLQAVRSALAVSLSHTSPASNVNTYYNRLKLFVFIGWTLGAITRGKPALMV